ncbi:MAG TPA: DUF1134 domain-containing protein [Candidatus Competibacter sp.]|jgi:hypothetical protein|nr:DUF1134 domain-containing protein [Candidatus Competibacter sp.]
MLKGFKVMGSALLATSLLVGGVALTAEAKQPVGKVSIQEKQFGLILGGSTGSGMLTFHGKKYPFKLKGLSAGANVGISKMSAVGAVYDLKQVADFSGTYTKLESSVALGGGVGGLHLKNEHGVIMELHSRTKGLDINIASMSGITITMK